MTAPVLSVRDLVVQAGRADGANVLIDHVSFDLGEGEILGLVGESGSGKTMTCRALMRLLPSRLLRITGGTATIAGQDILKLDDTAMQRVRGRTMGMIFQNPASHLDPLMRIGDQIGESLRFHHRLGRRDARARAIELLQQVGVPDPQRRVDNFPHEFSGGMRQRAMIAVALACDPKVLIADEPTTALDVTVQAQVLRLLLELRDRTGLSIILITHDLGVVAQTCDSIAVMYGGRLAERGSKRDVLSAPIHPYTAGLIACQPSMLDGGGRLRTIPGQPPVVVDWPTGCRFHPRCERATPACRQTAPALVDFAGRHAAACHEPVPVAPTVKVGT